MVMGFEVNHIEMKQERARALNDAQAIHLKAAEEGRDLTAEETQEYERRMGDAQRFREVLDRDAELRAQMKQNGAGSGADVDGARLGAGGDETRTDTERQSEEYRKAFTHYIQYGAESLDTEQRAALKRGFLAPDGERRDMLTSAATHGGYVVPQDFYNVVISAKIPMVALRQTKVRVITTSNGRDLPIPVQSAYGAATYLAEGATSSEVDDTGAKVTAKAYTANRTTKVSIQLLEDSAVPVANLVGENIARSFGVFENQEFAKGAGPGSSNITGFAAAVTVGHTNATGHTTNFTFPDVQALYYAVPPQYRQVGEWIFQDGALATLGGLVDNNNRPIWTAAQIPGEPDTLMGKPLYTCTTMDAPAASKIYAVFGDWYNGWVIRDDGRLQVRRSDERFIDSLEVGFISWERLDALQTDTQALRSGQYSAT